MLREASALAGFFGDEPEHSGGDGDGSRGVSLIHVELDNDAFVHGWTVVFFVLLSVIWVHGWACEREEVVVGGQCSVSY